MPTSGKASILIVEDDVVLREVIEMSLLRLGYEVFTANHGVEAFELLQKSGPVDLVLTDIRMPGGNGMDLLKRIQTELPEPPKVILMTGFTDVIFTKAIEAGAHSILTKPFTIQRLLEHLEEIEVPTKGPEKFSLVTSE